MIFELRHHFQIEAARHLPFLHKQHPCSRLHGHSFLITVILRGKQNKKTGWVLDYHEMSQRLKPLLDQIDHQNLNTIKGLENPTTENLTVWFYKKARQILPQIHSIIISETPQTECQYPIKK